MIELKPKALITGLIFLLVLMVLIICAVMFQDTKDPREKGGNTTENLNESRAKTGLLLISITSGIVVLATTLILIWKLQVEDE